MMESTEDRRKKLAKQRLTRTTHAIRWVARVKLATKKHKEEYSPILPGGPDKQQVVHRHSLREQIYSLICSSKINLFLLAVPASFLSYYGGWQSTWTFMFACMALCPLAAVLGDLTEDLSLRYNETIGALLNASFGNATELIVSIFALKAGMYDVIKDSLVGSVLGNMMLVLGTAFLAAGLRPRNFHGSSSFNSRACQVYCSLLLLASTGLIIPTVMFLQSPSSPQYVLKTSRQISLLMILGYALYVIFQLFTHKSLFDSAAGDHLILPGAASDETDDDEEADEPNYSSMFAVLNLCLCTVLISFESEFVVDTLEAAAKEWGLSHKFIAVILLPIVGNAAEHATAVTTAFKGKMDIALGVAVGSSIQISLFVVPILVIISWIMGRTLDLNFEVFTLTLMLASVVITKAIVQGGSSNWLSGVMLILVYAMIAVALFNTPDDSKAN